MHSISNLHGLCLTISKNGGKELSDGARYRTVYVSLSSTIRSPNLLSVLSTMQAFSRCIPLATCMVFQIYGPMRGVWILVLPPPSWWSLFRHSRRARLKIRNWSLLVITDETSLDEGSPCSELVAETCSRKVQLVSYFCINLLPVFSARSGARQRRPSDRKYKIRRRV
ncbi:uncharacterized protein LOC133912708 [Phragmites australis]|uniref:uncharacterized protein LOC133912708 n=1 Tax=Phragmites australis TaxID=29695 RepID=UPI002D78CED9|nr:uncharacterized protein LOC133912708 [Phragmites australis]